ncbi:hypothetical protein, partial [Azohydromonas lata]|uniref:hypothetical protein n=1 Tax=Azohydromonas lata TaxID=45677 RepID=UPI001C3F33FB
LLLRFPRTALRLRGDDAVGGLALSPTASDGKLHVVATASRKPNRFALHHVMPAEAGIHAGRGAGAPMSARGDAVRKPSSVFVDARFRALLSGESRFSCAAREPRRFAPPEPSFPPSRE